MEENKSTNNVYTDLDWNTVIEGAYIALTALAIEFLPTQEPANLMLSVIDEAKKLGGELPLPASRTALTAQACVIDRVNDIISIRTDGLATDTAEYKMFLDIRALLSASIANPETFESLLTSTLRFQCAVNRQ